MNGTEGLAVAEGKLQSRYGCLPVTGSEGLNKYNYNELAMRQGMRLLNYTEWLASAFGSPLGENGNNNYAWAKTTNTAKTFTGCQVNTSTGTFDNVSGVKPYAISAKNIVDAVGNVYESLSEQSTDTSSTSWAWQNVLGSNQGQAYLGFNKGLKGAFCGGRWDEGLYYGPRTILVSRCPWDVVDFLGARLACDSL
jgi:hypothetical protein